MTHALPRLLQRRHLKHLLSQHSDLWIGKATVAWGSLTDDISPKSVCKARRYHSDLPPYVNWAELVKPMIRRQASNDCGVRTAVTLIEYKRWIDIGVYIPLSVQQIIDCNEHSEPNEGISFANVFQYIRDYGLCSEQDYPYSETGSKGRCKYCEIEKDTFIFSYGFVPRYDEYAMLTAVAEHPIGVSLLLPPDRSFERYDGGLIYGTPTRILSDINANLFVDCHTRRTGMRWKWHAMTCVGYDKEAWILQNSWGETWGQNGFCRLKRDPYYDFGLLSSGGVYPITDPIEMAQTWNLKYGGSDLEKSRTSYICEFRNLLNTGNCPYRGSYALISWLLQSSKEGIDYTAI